MALILSLLIFNIINMNKNQISKLNMYQAVQQLLKNNVGITGTFNRLKTEVLNFEQKVTRIIELNTSLIAGTSGLTNGNTQLEQTMVEALCKLSRLALVWAKDEKNAILMAQFDVTKTDFARLADADCYAKANAITTQLETNATALNTAINIKAADIANVRLLVNNYQASLGTTQSAIKTNKSLSSETKTLFTQADASLTIITDLVINGQDDANFTNALLATRTINDAAVRRTGVTIAVTDAETNEPVTIAWAYVKGIDKKDDADQEGICELYKMRPGIYNIRIEAKGYQTENLSATVEQSKITELAISLKKGN